MFASPRTVLFSGPIKITFPPFVSPRWFQFLFPVILPSFATPTYAPKTSPSPSPTTLLLAAAPLLFSFTSLRLHLLRHLHFSPALRPEPSCPPKFSFLKIPHPLFPSTRPCPPLSIALTGNLLLVSIGTQPQLAKLHGSFYSIYASIANIFLCQSERLDIMLYHVSPALLQSSGDIWRHNSFHAVFIRSSHHNCRATSIWPLVFH